MWNVNPDKDHSRGGFQNRDVGRRSFDGEFGPEYGIDYARFAANPDPLNDHALRIALEEQLPLDRIPEGEIQVRNGFVILKGTVANEASRQSLLECVRGFPGVVEVINQLSLESHL